MRIGLLSLGVLLAGAACSDAPPRPILDKQIVRGTALPPPGIALGPSDGK